MKQETLDRIVAARTAKIPFAVVTDLDTGIQGIVETDRVSGDLDLDPDPETVRRVRANVTDDRSGRLAGTNLFVHVHNPPLRLIIVGAVHISQALAPMASLAGYDVTVIDPRRAFATDARFPDVETIGAWPDDAMSELAPDARSAVVTLTHDPKLDDPALHVALRSPAFYIGSLGSARTHARRLERLAENGFTRAEMERINGPVGLAINAKSPAEIAISILGQMTRALRGQPAPERRRDAA